MDAYDTQFCDQLPDTIAARLAAADCLGSTALPSSLAVAIEALREYAATKTRAAATDAAMACALAASDRTDSPRAYAVNWRDVRMDKEALNERLRLIAIIIAPQ